MEGSLEIMIIDKRFPNNPLNWSIVSYLLYLQDILGKWFKTFFLFLSFYHNPSLLTRRNQPLLYYTKYRVFQNIRLCLDVWIIIMLLELLNIITIYLKTTFELHMILYLVLFLLLFMIIVCFYLIYQKFFIFLLPTLY